MPTRQRIACQHVTRYVHLVMKQHLSESFIDMIFNRTTPRLTLEFMLRLRELSRRKLFTNNVPSVQNVAFRQKWSQALDSILIVFCKVRISLFLTPVRNDYRILGLLYKLYFREVLANFLTKVAAFVYLWKWNMHRHHYICIYI